MIETDYQNLKESIINEFSVFLDKTLRSKLNVEPETIEETITRFIDSCCIISDVSNILSGRLYYNYKYWSKENNIPIISQNLFSRRLNKMNYKGITHKTGKYGGYFYRVDLIS